MKKGAIKIRVTIRMNEIDIAVRRVQRSIMKAIVLQWTVVLLTIWFFVWGISVLILRIALGIDGYLLYGAIGIPVILIVSCFLARRKLPTSEQIRAKLDAMNSDGGILMIDAEEDFKEWSGEVVVSNLPIASWHNNRVAVAFAAACFFVLVAFFMPQPKLPVFKSKTLAIDELIESLQAKVELINQEEIIDDERTADINENLEKIAEDAEDGDPMKTWEALDHIADSLKSISNDASEDIMKMLFDATAMDALAESLQKAIDEQGLSAEINKAIEEMAALMANKELLNALDGMISAELAEALQKLELSPEQLKELAKALKECKGESLDKMCKLCDASMVDPDMLKKCKGVANDKDSALMAFLDENASDVSSLLAACMMPGNGGVSRGRGDAPLTWKDGCDENGVGFKEEVIQPFAPGGLENSKLVGISKGAPTANDTPVTVTGGELENAAIGGGGAHKQRVLPQHKHVVMKYFDRGDEDNAETGK